jgi:CheY-like chemotaxis protein
VDAAEHELRVHLPDETLWLHADPTRLTQVFTNLLNNAASYTPPGGRIDVVAARAADRLSVTVRDTGIGISRDHLRRIFEMFSQARPVLERPNAGLGIGLSLAKGLVELHDGTISAASEGEGRGSEFTVMLPRAEGPERAAAPVPPRHVRGSSLKILVVDDNRDAADGLAKMLELLGHVPAVAYDGPEALDTAEREPPDVILLDIGLPSMNGYEVARRVRDRPWGRQVLLVAQTGWGKEQDKRRAADAGFDHHLIKPLDAGQLVQLLTEVA